MPDQELLGLAENRTLSNPATLRSQVERMLNHSKAEAFIQNFTDSWLDLIEIDFTTPIAICIRNSTPSLSTRCSAKLGHSFGN